MISVLLGSGGLLLNGQLLWSLVMIGTNAGEWRWIREYPQFRFGYTDNRMHTEYTDNRLLHSFLLFNYGKRARLSFLDTP